MRGGGNLNFFGLRFWFLFFFLFFFVIKFFKVLFIIFLELVFFDWGLLCGVLFGLIFWLVKIFLFVVLWIVGEGEFLLIFFILVEFLDWFLVVCKKLYFGFVWKLIFLIFFLLSFRFFIWVRFFGFKKLLDVLRYVLMLFVMVGFIFLSFCNFIFDVKFI